MNGMLYILLLFASVLLWFALLACGELLFRYAKFYPPSWMMIALSLTGVCADYLLVSQGPICRWYLFRGRGVLLPGGFELSLQHKTCRVDYHDIERMFYRNRRWDKGFVLSAKGASFYLEEARSVPPGDWGGLRPESLPELYRQIEVAWLASKKATGARDNSNTAL